MRSTGFPHFSEPFIFRAEKTYDRWASTDRYKWSYKLTPLIEVGEIFTQVNPSFFGQSYYREYNL